MAQTIKILDPQEAIKIAAGEVVERPAHIIKELIENSIDAQASNITIYTRASGKNEISITDDGFGMSSQDAKLCFAHHSTSKISTVHDLENIVTYGFRGEALSSIASVSHVELTTKTQEEKSATHLVLHDAKLIIDDFAAHPTGTTISITHLFANIPARKKFLKSDDTEWNLIVSIFQAFCLRKQNIHFKLFHNGHLAYNCPPTTDIKVRCMQLWSGNLGENLLAIPPTTIKNISIAGAISAPHYYRFNRGQIFTFINNRWVKNIEITKGIIKGYDGVLPSQKYPAAFLFVDIDPTQVDINVHPKKEEVKFLHPGVVQKTAEEIVKQTLNQSINQRLSTHTIATTQSTQGDFKQWAEPVQNNAFSAAYAPEKFEDDNQVLASTAPTLHVMQRQQAFVAQAEIQHVAPLKKLTAFSEAADNHILSLALDSQDNEASSTPPSFRSPVFASSFANHSRDKPNTSLANSEDRNQHSHTEKNDVIYEQEPFSIVGQFKKTYIMIERAQQLILVDQHAAHERILYERFKNNSSEQAQSIQLLFPHIVKLHSSDIEQLCKHEQIFAKHGIIFEQFSQTEIIIQATPVSMQAQSAQEVISLTLDLIKHDETNPEQLFEKLHDKILAEKACKTACKGGDTLDHKQMDNLIQELQKTDNRFCCPHGRPTLWSMELKEIEKHFKRDYVGSKNNQQGIF